MGTKNTTGVRRIKSGTKTRLFIDFRYTNAAGVRDRCRRIASVQNYAAALAEAARLMKRAAETGKPEEHEAVAIAVAPACLTYRQFVEGPFETEFMPRYRPSTQVRYRALHRQSVMAFFGDKALNDITKGDFRSFDATLKQKGIQSKGPVTLARTVVRAAYDSGHRDAPPDVPPGLVKTSRKLPDAPSPEDVVVMLTAPGWLGVAIALASLAGLRMAEVRGIEVRDVDLDGERLFVRRSLSEDVPVKPKNGDERVVPLVPELASRLREAMKSKLPRARIVVDDRGRTPRRQETLRVFKAFLRKNNLRERSFHSLRHYFITELVRRGVGLEAVRLLAGHSKLEMTQRYAHATAEDLRAAMDRFGK